MIITDEMLFEHAAEARDIWLSVLSPKEDTPTIQCSKEFERKMSRLVNAQKRSAKTSKFIHGAKQVVAAVLVVAIISFGGLMTVEAYREKVIDFIAHVCSEFTEFRFTSDSMSASEFELPEITFHYLPDGMSEVENRTTSAKRRYILYEDKDGRFFELTLQSISANEQHSILLDTEDSTFKYITINGNEGFCNTKGNDSIIVWVKGNILYDLCGNVDIKELMRIAEALG